MGGVSENLGGYLIEVLITRGSYYLGFDMHIPYFRKPPSVE